MSVFEADDDPFARPKEEKLAPERPVFVKPTGTLKDLDLDKELYDQYFAAKELAAAALYDTEAGLNQKVQANNAIVNILSQIVKLQSDLYNAQTIARLENILIAVLKDFPEVKAKFLEAYEGALNVSSPL